MSAFSDAVLALSPSGYWRFTGASPLADSGPSGFTLTTWGSPTRAPSLVPGESSAANEAYYLNGTSGFDAGDNLDETADFTVAAWIKPDTGCWDFWPILQKQGGSPANGYSWHRSITGFSMDVSNAGVNDGATCAGSIAIGTLTFVVGVWNSASQDLSHYENGVFKATDTTPAINPGNSTVPLIIGGNQAKDTSGTGWIDEVAIWTGVMLTGTQITNLYTAGLAAAAGVSNRFLVRSSRGTSW